MCHRQRMLWMLSVGSSFPWYFANVFECCVVCSTGKWSDYFNRLCSWCNYRVAKLRPWCPLVARHQGEGNFLHNLMNGPAIQLTSVADTGRLSASILGTDDALQRPPNRLFRPEWKRPEVSPHKFEFQWKAVQEAKKEKKIRWREAGPFAGKVSARIIISHRHVTHGKINLHFTLLPRDRITIRVHCTVHAFLKGIQVFKMFKLWFCKVEMSTLI